MVLSEEKKELFHDIRELLGCSVRKVELTDDKMCSLLRQSVGDYSVYVQKYIIKNNWAQLYGKNSTNIDLAFNLSMRSLDMTKDYLVNKSGYNKEGSGNLKKTFSKLKKEDKYILFRPVGK